MKQKEGIGIEMSRCGSGEQIRAVLCRSGEVRCTTGKREAQKSLGIDPQFVRWPTTIASASHLTSLQVSILKYTLELPGRVG